MPKELFFLTQLQTLDLSFNVLVILPECSNSEWHLRELNISGNKIQSLGESLLATLSRLRHLHWTNSRIPFFPSEIQRLTALQTLNLSSNRISDSCSLCISLVDLDNLNLSHNPITDIPNLSHFINLKQLNLSHCNFSDWPPLGKLKLLQEIDLSENKIKKPIDPAILKQFSDLQVLNIANNQITGEIPKEIRECSQLRELDISCNQIVKIHAGIGEARNSLRKLHLQNNQLTTLPGELGLVTPSIDLKLDRNPMPKLLSYYEQSIPTLLDALTSHTYTAVPMHTVVSVAKEYPAHSPNSFTFQARDLKQNPRITGGDAFSIDPPQFKDTFIIKDQNDGSYKVFFNIPPGEYKFFLLLEGEQAARIQFTAN